MREDILEFSRIHEIKAIRLLVDLLRERVGSPIFHARYPQAAAIQLVKNLRREESVAGITVADAARWLSELKA